jgi:hypothetical protein
MTSFGVPNESQSILVVTSVTTRASTGLHCCDGKPDGVTDVEMLGVGVFDVEVLGVGVGVFDVEVLGVTVGVFDTEVLGVGVFDVEVLGVGVGVAEGHTS